MIDERGSHITKVEEIKPIAPSYYESLFNQNDYWRSFPALPVKKVLTPAATSWISRQVSNEEIKKAVPP